MPNPVPTDFNMLEHAKTVSRSNVEDLTEPEEDPLPILMWVGPYGVGLFPLTSMVDEAAKDELATWMTTMIAVSRATEAVMTAASWTVNVPEATPNNPNPTGIVPSEHPDRIETVTLMYVNATGDGDLMVRGDLTRYPDKPPTMSEWEECYSNVRLGGRFGDAIHMGFDLCSGMPEELVSIIDAAWAKGDQEDLMKRFRTIFGQWADDIHRRHIKSRR